MLLKFVDIIEDSYVFYNFIINITGNKGVRCGLMPIPSIAATEN